MPKEKQEEKYRAFIMQTWEEFPFAQGRLEPGVRQERERIFREVRDLNAAGQYEQASRVLGTRTGPPLEPWKGPSLLAPDTRRKSTYNIGAVREALPRMPAKMQVLANHVIGTFTTDGFMATPTFCDRPTDIFVDASTVLDPAEEAVVLEKLRTDKEKGFCVGPFPRPPFPLDDPADTEGVLLKQSVISRLFSIPKQKGNPEAGRRMINDASFPRSRPTSLNAGTRRSNSGIPTLATHFWLRMVAELGPGTLAAGQDEQSCYHQTHIDPAAWAEQVIKAAQEYWFYPVGQFGRVSAGDANDCRKAVTAWIVNELLRETQRRREERLDYFVDNFGMLTAPLSAGRPDWSRAKHRATIMQKALRQLGLQCHEEFGPTTRFVWLGWKYDTMAMTVAVPKKRRPAILQALRRVQRGDVKITRRQAESLTGKLFHISFPLQAIRPVTNIIVRWAAGMPSTTAAYFPSVAARRAAELLLRILKHHRRWTFDLIPAFAQLEPSQASLRMASDASGWGGGWVLVRRGPGEWNDDIINDIPIAAVSFKWTSDELKAARREKEESMPDLELDTSLRGMAAALQSIKQMNKGEERRARARGGGYIIVWVETDCFGNVSRISNNVKRGGDLLERMATLMEEGISLRTVFVVRHRSGERNIRPDHLSREEFWEHESQVLRERGFLVTTPAGSKSS